MIECCVFTLPENSTTGEPARVIRAAQPITRSSTRRWTTDDAMGVRKSSSRPSMWWMTCITFRTRQAIFWKRRGNLGCCPDA